MSQLQDFVQTWAGKQPTGWPGYRDPYGAQCVVLPNLWCAELGIELFWGNAADFLGDPHSDCDWVQNLPDNAPPPGSILVWSSSGWLPFGHTGIALWGSTPALGGLTSFDLNWPLGSAAHVQAHTYDGLAGWYLPRLLEANPQEVSQTAIHLAAPVVGGDSTPDGSGYYLVAADGGVFAFGTAQFYGSMGGKRLAAPVVGMKVTRSGRGYWLFAADGGVFAFGDAAFQGSAA